MSDYIISPTLACANFLNLQQDIYDMDRAGVDFYHIDLMDGNYVPNLSLNYDIIKGVKSISKTPLDVHIMAINPMDYIESLSKIGVEYIATHIDAVNIEKWIEVLKAKKIKVGLAVKLTDDVSKIEKYLKYLDLVLVMGVKPGFSGQSFNDFAVEQISKLNMLREKFKLDFIIEVDGGIDKVNIIPCKKAGCDMFVVGALAVFDQEESLYNCCKNFKNK